MKNLINGSIVRIRILIPSTQHDFRIISPKHALPDNISMPDFINLFQQGYFTQGRYWETFFRRVCNPHSLQRYITIVVQQIPGFVNSAVSSRADFTNLFVLSWLDCHFVHINGLIHTHD